MHAMASAATSSSTRRPRSLSRIHFGKDAAAAHRLSLALDAHTMSPPRDALPVPAVPPAPTHRGCAKQLFEFDERSARGARSVSTSIPNTPRSQRQNVGARNPLGKIENLQVVLLDLSAPSPKTSHDAVPPRFPRSLTLPANVGEFRNVRPHEHLPPGSHRPHHLRRPQSSKFAGESSRRDLVTPSRQRPHSANVGARTLSHRNVSSENFSTQNTSSRSTSTPSKPHSHSSHISRHAPPTTRASKPAADFDFGSMNTHMGDTPPSTCASRGSPNFAFNSLSTGIDLSTADTTAMQISPSESDRPDIATSLSLHLDNSASASQSFRPPPTKRFASVPLQLGQNESSQSFRPPPPSTRISKRAAPGFDFGAMNLVSESDRTVSNAGVSDFHETQSSNLQDLPSTPTLKFQSDAMFDSTPATPQGHVPPAPTHRGSRKRGIFSFHSGEDSQEQASSGIISLGAIENLEPVIICESEIPEVQMEMDTDTDRAFASDASALYLGTPPTSSSRRFGNTSFAEARSQRARSSPGRGGGAANKNNAPRFPSLSIAIAEDDGKDAEKPFVPLNNSDNLLHEVVPRVFISSVRGARNQSEVTRYGITAVINCTTNLPQDHPDLNFLRVPVRDRWGADLLSHFEKANEFISSELQHQSARVLVHCRAGISRSTAIIMAYLIHSRNLSVDEALQTVQQARACAQPNVDFVGQLDKFKAVCSSRMSSTGDE